MKNLYILPTDKVSKLYKLKDNLYLEEYPIEDINAGNQHIYIINRDEEIKEEDWYLANFTYLFQHRKGSPLLGITAYKIILTTDQSLNGVQIINDEFLQWFVNNPTCEKVEITSETYFTDEVERCEGLKDGEKIKKELRYNIIIPKEEFKQETLEEASTNYANMHQDVSEELGIYLVKAVFQDGAIWQQERLYSKEDMINAFNEGQALNVRGKLIQGKEWFEQFKK